MRNFWISKYLRLCLLMKKTSLGCVGLPPCSKYCIGRPLHKVSPWWDWLMVINGHGYTVLIQNCIDPKDPQDWGGYQGNHNWGCHLGQSSNQMPRTGRFRPARRRSSAWTMQLCVMITNILTIHPTGMATLKNWLKLQQIIELYWIGH